MNSEPLTFTIPAHIAQIKSRADRTFALTLNTTRELSSDDGSTLLSLMHQEGTMAFRLSAFKDEELLNLPDIQPDFRGEKSPGQRLRAVLYRQWEQGKAPMEVGTFEMFYRNAMERLIDHEKAKLEP